LNTMVRKKFKPKDINDLMDIFYKPENADRKRRYLSHVDSQFHDPIREAEAKRITNNFGKSLKISTTSKKTPDFKIEENKIVYEITSIQYSEKERITQAIKPRPKENFIEDLNIAIQHALEKDYSGYENYRKMVIIFIDTILAGMCNYTSYAANSSIVKETVFADSDLSHMLILPFPSNLSNEFPHVAYTKDTVLAKKLEEKLPKIFRVIVI
jgi:hypothetical protein